MALITPTTSYDGFDQVDIVVEAVFEDMELKKAHVRRSRRASRDPDCVLASNTSTLDIDEFAQASGRPAQVIGHHFFSPANVMKLLEIVRGRETSREVIATSLELGQALGKVGVVVGNCFGFVANRMLAYYMREAYLLLEEGASVPQIDGVLTDFGLPVGPFGMQDIAGIDVGARIRQYLKSTGQDARRRAAVGRAGSPVRDGTLRPEDRRRLVQVRGRQPRRAFRIRSSRRSPPRRRPRAGSRAARSPTTRFSRGSRRRWPTKARGCSTTATRCAPATSTSSTATASASRGTAAGRCSTPTRSACRTCSRASGSTASRFGDYWKPAPLLERLVADGRSFHEPA